MVAEDTRDELLADAASCASPLPGAGDLAVCLRAYYRHVAEDDLTEAGPERLAAVTTRHIRLAAHRPQGRALVEVRPGGTAVLAEPADVIDIVTDDMPFLVDSVTMELANHGLSARLIVHPQLRVRRDVAGALREIVGPAAGAPGVVPRADTAEAPESAHDVLVESWIHVEIPPLADGEAPVLAADIERVLGDVRVAVEDYPRMRARALWLADEVLALAAKTPETESPAEIANLLRWLTSGHFTFLGYREYDLVRAADSMSLRVVPGTGLGILRHDRRGAGSFARLPDEAKARALDQHRLILTKANSRSTVHRASYLDYVAVKRLSAAGEVDGEYRFLGLYTHAATAERVKDVPVLRRKLAEVLAISGLSPDSHDGKDAAEVLDFYPREELFMTPAADLAAIAAGVHLARERRQTRLFVRRDVYGRYVSCLVYLPRDRYTTPARLAVQEILRRAFGASQVDYSAQVGESAIAKLHVVLRAERGHQLADDADPASLEREVAAAVRSWDDDLAVEAARTLGAQRGRELVTQLGGAVPVTYKTDVPASAAITDLARILRLRESGRDVDFELWESETYTGGVPIEDGEADGGGRVWRLTIYSAGGPITLTDVLPRLQHMGVDVVDEHPYEFPAAEPFWIYDFGLRRTATREADTGGRDLMADQRIREQVESALGALWGGRISDDDFNALVLDAQLTWQQVVMLRGYARYLRQAKISFSQEYIARALRSNASITRLLVRLFESRFDPAKQAGEAERSEAITEEINGALDGVASLDEDRILRSYLGLIAATLRTNYYSTAFGPVPSLVVKMNAREVPGLPAPWPQFEMFVYSPRFEGVHLRFAPVARGGLRWSDRPEDFRTEILDLAKAQEVKNAVIVPSGAKGGFVCQQLPEPTDREAYAAEVLACYRMFITAMLDVTDNLVEGQVIPPAQVMRHDGDDPYLVVAADKGTATFSDTANEIAQARGFWLGDAFASGGSEGYDHKKMGITARGAWESARYHFRALGVDVDADDFTVAGIGDMSGDVFGNGMLLSSHIVLVAAFDHRHVFLDPSPDRASSLAERRRLFELPRSSWADYDAGLISAGGGVWPRSAKSIPLSPQARAVLGLSDADVTLSPDAVISAILAAPVDLLWNGGIGTYVKASYQSNADVGDRANDGVRIDAAALRARVAVEGGNLGLTQQGRVEFALAGGLVCTDFIDNSAGVDTSDHEVNIKILLDREVRSGALTPAGRNELLHAMTDEIASHVLEHNYQQVRVLATAVAQAPQMLHVHARYIHKLERDGRIRRKLDVLPTDREIAERRTARGGLVLPEFAVLLAQTKIATAEEVLASGLPDQAYLHRVLADYFPSALRAKYADGMAEHPLRREIITTVVANDMVDRSGITFAFRLAEETGASVPDITAAWLVARAVFVMPGFWTQVDALDGLVDTGTQVLAMLEGRKLTERAARWLLAFRRPPFDVQDTIDYFGAGVLTVGAGLPKLLAGRDLTGFDERREFYLARGVPADLSDRIAAMVPAYSAFDIVDIAHGTGRSVEETAEVYFDLADRLQIARLRDLITALPREDRWNTMARAAIRDDLYTAHAALTRDVLAVTGPGSPEQRLAAWVSRNAPAVRRADQTLTEIWESNDFTVATLSVAVRAVRSLVTTATLPG
ncbi:MAG TPA: NAD-glutamate dehydrogenase [Streptosporangiaceae bacterium]